MSQDPSQQAAPGDPAAPADPQAPAEQPTLEEQVAKLLEGQTRISSDVQVAIATAQAAEQAARRAQGQSHGTVKRLERELAEARSTLDDLVTRDMSDEQRTLFKQSREIAALKDRQAAPTDNPEAVQDFQSYSARVLTERGVKATDPRLRAAFDTYVGDSSDPVVWRQGLAFAIADVKADEAKLAESSVKERERLAREEERARATATTRRAAGPVDRGAPSGTTRPAKNVWDMSDAEFAEFEKTKDRSVGRETPAPRAP